VEPHDEERQTLPRWAPQSSTNWFPSTQGAATSVKKPGALAWLLRSAVRLPHGSVERGKEQHQKRGVKADVQPEEGCAQ
jgi:hypothetical protein